MFPQAGNEVAPSSTMPSPEDVLDLLQNLLPPATEVFTLDFFKQPLFAPATLYDTASYYGCHNIDEEFEESLSLSDLEKNNNSIKTMIWLAHTFGCDTEATIYVFDMHKQSRRLVRIQQTALGTFVGDNTPVTVANVGATYQSPRATPDLPRDDPLQNQSHGSAKEAQPKIKDVPDTHPAVSHARHSRVPIIGSQGSHGDDVRKSSYVHQYFKGRKFTGEIDQSIDMFIRDYKICSRQYQLSNQQRTDYFVNILEGPARTFFFHNAEDSMSSEEMMSMMLKEYNSDARQQQIKGTLDTLRLSTFMSEHEISSV